MSEEQAQTEEAQEVSGDSRGSNDAGQSFLDAINATESSDELMQMMAAQAQKEAERIAEEGFKNPFSINADKKTAKALAAAESPQDIAAVAEEQGFKRDHYGTDGTTDLLSPYEEKIDPEDLGQALAEATSQAEIADVMRRAGLTVNYG